MSRIGKRQINIPEKVNVEIKDGLVNVRGPKGELSEKLHPHVKAEVEKNIIKVSVSDPDLKGDRALWGLFNALISNMVVGVVDGFSKQLEINGVGFKAEVKGKKIVLLVGFSHPVELDMPEGITCVVEKNLVTVSGIDKQKVGAFAAKLRSIKKPEPYKGKGIKYVGEHIIRKAGKQAKGSTGGAAS